MRTLKNSGVCEHQAREIIIIVIVVQYFSGVCELHAREIIIIVIVVQY